MTLREQVARAMHIEVHGPSGLSPDAVTVCGPPSEIGQPAWKFHEARADAAISCVLAALKEPSEMMIMAGRLENGYVITDIVRTKQEMSDEILSIRYRAMLAAFTRDLGTPGEGAPPRREGS